MSAIRAILAKEILDSQGDPTISVTVWTDDGFMVESSIPTGSKTFPHEAQILLDLDPEHKNGKGVQKAVQLINQQIAPQLIGKDHSQQEQLDQQLIALDSTPLKTQIGANTIAALSQALFKAGAASMGMSVYQRLFEQYHLVSYLKIPTCVFGLINGGKYGSNNLDIQEFLIIPASHMDYRVSLEIESDLRTNLLSLLKSRKASYSTGILGGYTPSLQKNTDVFDFIIETAHKTDYILSRDFFFGVDCGAENLVDRDRYILRDKSTVYSDKEIFDFYKKLKEKYNITYFEDPFTIKDLNLWKEFTKDIGNSTKVVLDTYTVTNSQRIQEAIQNSYGNTVVIKPSQIGTVTEALQAVKTARDAGWSIVVSQRSGETNDDFLADFAVGIGADFVKFGSANRGESVEKYNRLADIYLEIEQQMLEGETMNQSPPQDPSTNQPMGDQTSAEATASAVPTTNPDPTVANQPTSINPFVDPTQDQTEATPTVIAPNEPPVTTPVAETMPAAPMENIATPPTTEIPMQNVMMNEPPNPPANEVPVNVDQIVTQPPMTPPVNQPNAPVTQPVAVTENPATPNLSLGQTPEITTPAMNQVGLAAQPPMNMPVAPSSQPMTQVVPPPQPEMTATTEPKEEIAPEVVQEAIDSTLAELSPTETAIDKNEPQV